MYFAMVKMDTGFDRLEKCSVYSMHRTVSAARKAAYREYKETGCGYGYTKEKVASSTSSVPREQCQSFGFGGF